MVDQITADELAETVDSGESFSLVDTRPKESFESWHIAGAENVPYDPREAPDEGALERFRRENDGKPVITICGKGLTSTPFAFELEERGVEDVAVVQGGMQAWAGVYEVVPIATESEDLLVRQVQRRGKGCLGYVVGSRATGEAAIVDATRHTDTFAVAAQEAGLTIVAAIDTHVHADHISGTPAMARQFDVPYYLGDGAIERDLEYDFEAVVDGDAVEVGSVELEAIHAPGHTAEMVNYLVDGEVLLTADTLFVDGLGRTELQFGDEGAARGARQLYATLHDRLRELSEDVTVFPGHVTVTDDGRFESGSPGDPIAATLGTVRDRIDALDLDEDAFVDRIVDDAPEKPPNYETVVAINEGREHADGEDEAAELELGPNNCAA